MIEKIGELLYKYGIKSQSMDDIARELGISKKTLYLHFKDKKDLVMQVVMQGVNKQSCKFSEIVTENKFNAIDILFFVSKQIAENHKNINQNVHFDLQKYYPEAWQILSEHNKKHVYGKICQNMEQGIQEGLYLDDLKINIIAKLYVQQVNNLSLIEDINEDLSFDEILKNIFVYHIRGIASEKGREYLEYKLKQYDNK
ncbi:MAG: TetR/AcrR family transcriptional regulator, partial [Bacteroidales bacterium]|nr:TetR/AcrR family transcriptional regulator [Bacteroidales bacterium]